MQFSLFPKRQKEHRGSNEDLKVGVDQINQTKFTAGAKWVPAFLETQDITMCDNFASSNKLILEVCDEPARSGEDHIASTNYNKNANRPIVFT